MEKRDRGGPQIIPRPAGAVPGAPPPWSVIPPSERRLTAADLRREFAGRIGEPSWVESHGVSRPSAVLAAFFEEDGESHVVLTRRSWGLRAHTGEVSFPGGACDLGESLVDAALREAQEEIGLAPGSVEILGELDHLMTVTSRSFIVPFVALLPGRPEVAPNPDEVDEVLLVPVSELLRDDVYREERWRFTSAPPWVPPDLITEGGPIDRSIFFFELYGDTVWGATAAMLRHLLGMALGLGTGIDHA